MSKPSKQPPPQNVLDLYDKLLVNHPEIPRKGATIPYTSVNGNMFTYFGEHGLSIRLPDTIRQEFLERYDTTLYEAYGIVQKEYVAVPAELFENTEELQPYFDASYEYAKTLKPKPTKKKD